MLYNITNLKKKYGQRTVLAIERLTLEKGKVYTLTGPNGAGKTTLLKILALLSSPTSGEIEFLGEKVQFKDKSLYQARKSVVLLDQNPIMFTGTVRENVGYGLKIRKVDKVETERRIHEVLDLVGLKKFIDHDAKALSGGETKRVALARALAIEPEVLICDEPSANVDNENQEMILDALARANRRNGTSIIFSTHYLSQGQRLADQALLLQNGCLSDILNENIYRSLVVEKKADFSLCQLSGQVSLQVSSELIGDHDEVKVWLDPETITYDLAQQGSAKKPARVNSLSGHLVEVGRQKGMVKLCVDVGVKVVMYTSYEKYRKTGLLLGDKVIVEVPLGSIRCTPV